MCDFYIECFSLLFLSIITAIFPGESGLAGFIIGAKDDGGGGDNNWSCKMCKLSPPTNQHPMFFSGRMPFLSPDGPFSVRALNGTSCKLNLPSVL